MNKTNKANKANKTNKANCQSAPESGNGKRQTANALTAVSAIAFILFAFWMLPGRNSYMLQWYDEMSLFEPTRFFFRQCMHYPGGFFSYIGSWLTQLLFYPFLGATVLMLLWLLTAWLTIKAFRLPREAAQFAFVVPMAMLVSVVQIDDAWLSMKSVGYMYSNTIGYLFAVTVLWLYRISEKRPPIATGILVASAVCYFIAGFYGLFAAFIGIIFMVADCIRGRRFVNLLYPALVLAVILMLPPLYYTTLRGNTVDNDYLYLKGLPDFLMEAYDLYLWTPFIVATTFILLLAILSALRWLPSGGWMKWIGVASLCICAFWCVKADKKNEQLRATVVMLHHLQRNDWERMNLVMSRIKEPPNYTMRMLNNFAVLNLGGTPENLDKIKPSNKDPRHAETFSVTAYISVPINYYNGDFNQSYRWGMEHCVQYGKRVFFLKYMVKSALLNGDVKVAKKYNDLLLGTMFHRRWAEKMKRYIDDPSLIRRNIEFNAILDLAQQ